jgi:hypothetical protein
MADFETVAPGMILDFCQSVEVSVTLPGFMAQYQDLNRRASATGGYFPEYTGYGSPGSTGSPGDTLPGDTSPEDTSPEDTSPGSGSSSSGRKSKGMAFGARIGIGVAVPLIVLGIVLLIIFVRKYRRKHRQPPINEIQQQEKNDGGLPEHIRHIPEIRDSTMPMPPPSYMGSHEYRIESSGAPIQPMQPIPFAPSMPAQFQPMQPMPSAANTMPAPKFEPPRGPQATPPIHEIDAARAHLQAVGVPVHEVESTRLRLQAAGIPIHSINANHPALELAGTPPNPRHELTDSRSGSRHEMTLSPSPYHVGSDSSSRKAVSPQPSVATPFFPPPWHDVVGSSYEAYESPHVEPQNTNTEGGREIQRLEEEMAQVKLRKERLQHLHELDEREAALKRTIEEKRKRGPSGY